MVEAQNNHENLALQHESNASEIEGQLKETQEMFEQGKATWAKEEAVIKQKLEFVQYQYEDEKKKSEE